MKHANDLDIDLLRAFIAVAEAGSFTAAAEVIGRSQSAVSQKILRLEDILEWRVFERSSRALTLTREGERLLLNARRMLGHFEDFLHDLKAPPTINILRLGISENLVPTQLPRLLSRFSGLYPDIQLELSTGRSVDLLAEHESGLLDVVIAKRKTSGSAHRGRVIWREPLVWIAPSDYTLDPAHPLRLVLMRPPCAYRAIMIEALASVKREWTSACIASNLMGLQAAVTAGLGITALGASFVQPGMQILQPSGVLPTLPMTEVAVVGDNPDMQHLIQPLVSLLTEGLMAGSSLTQSLDQ